MKERKQQVDRRNFIKSGGRWMAVVGLGSAAVGLCARSRMAKSGTITVWQIDPTKCIGCGNCTRFCVQNTSAVKCFHNHRMCGYCKLCTGFFDPNPIETENGAENQICPTAAIRRRFIEDPHFEYVIDADLCIGCGKCVEGCTSFGNGSLFLQIDQSLCKQCNQCAIEPNCPSHAIHRRPAGSPYCLKSDS